MAKAIGTLGNVDSLTIGGVTFTDLTNLIVLTGAVGAINNKTTLRKPDGTAGYQVTVGKTLTHRAVMLQIKNSTVTSTTYPKFQYSDNDVGVDTVTAFTNPVFYGGDTFNATFGLNVQALAASNHFPIFWSVPATKYSGINAETANFVTWTFGVEA